MPPAVILEDIARVYRDIGDQWSALTWWLCRIHESSVLSAMPILGYANYVLVLENEYVNLGRRPHGLMELVCGDDSYLFPTVLPEWLNWPLLQAFLEPISHCNHFGMGMMGFYNGDRLSQRLVQCNSGFFVQVHYISTVFFLRELLTWCTGACEYSSCNGSTPGCKTSQEVCCLYCWWSLSTCESILRDDGLPRTESYNG